LPAVF